MLKSVETAYPAFGLTTSPPRVGGVFITTVMLSWREEPVLMAEIAIRKIYESPP